MEPTEQKCPSCGESLPPDVPLGLCPQCLIKSGFLTGPPSQPAETEPSDAPSLEQLTGLFPQLDILELIGRGGMGAVYKARQPRLNRFVALKLLARSRAVDPQFAERFQREAQALAQMNHPNVVQVYDFGEIGGIFYLLMEYVDGLNLRQLQQARKITPEEALTIVPPICEALQYAHARGIVHRDIKPENILLDKEGRVKIADFGIARILGRESEDQTITGDRQVIGTPHYMAPEQIEKPATVDQRADIYSLGVVFYEMLTGELPLGRFAPPSQKVQVDVRLDEVVLRALEKEPERRYQQASEIKTQLETIATSTTRTVPVGIPGTGMPMAMSDGSDRSVRSDKTDEFNALFAPPPPKPRLSRAALWGAAWAPWFFLALLPLFIAKTVAVVPGSRPSGSAWWQIIMMVTLLPLGLSAPFGTTILGYVAISHIRHSGGRLYGRALAVADLLLFPLLVMGGIIARLVNRFFATWKDIYDQLGEYHPWFAFLARNQTEFTLLLITVVALPIIYFVWRAANRPISQAATQSSAAPQNPPRKRATRPWRILVVLIALVAIAAGIINNRPGVRTSYRKAAHIGRNNHSVLIHHNDQDLCYALFYAGDFTSNVRDSHNTRSLLWAEEGAVTLHNGRTFAYQCESVLPQLLRINGHEYDLKDGTVFTLLDDGTADQLKLFPSLATARNVDELAALISTNGPAPATSFPSAASAASSTLPVVAASPRAELGRTPTPPLSLPFAGKLQFRWVATDAEHGEAEQLPWQRKPRPDSSATIPLLKEALFSEADIASVELKAPDSPQELPTILLHFRPSATQRLADVTGKNVGRQLAIAMNGRVVMAPLIKSAVTGGLVAIAGSFSSQDIEAIAGPAASAQWNALTAVRMKGDLAELTSITLNYAETRLQRKEEFFAVGRIGRDELEQARFERDIAAAQMKGSPADVTSITLQYTKDRLERLEEMHKVGRATQEEIEKARFERDKAALLARQLPGETTATQGVR